MILIAFSPKLIVHFYWYSKTLQMIYNILYSSASTLKEMLSYGPSQYLLERILLLLSCEGLVTTQGECSGRTQ